MKYSVVIKNICKAALITKYPHCKAFFSKFNFCVVKTKKRLGTHYQFNDSMFLETVLNMKPLLIGFAVQQYTQSSLFSGIFDSVTVTQPGFVNFLISLRCLRISVSRQINNLRQGVAITSKVCKVIFDYSSPNVAKNLHAGHLRTTLIGDCLSRFFKYKGYDVLALNHVGDWGTNFGLINAYLKQYEQDIDLVTLEDLECIYKKAKAKLSTDSNFATLAGAEVISLQKKDTKSIVVWRRVCSLSVTKFNQIYKYLNVKIHLRGESFYNYLLSNVVLLLQSKRLLSMSYGTKCVYLKNFYNRNGTLLPIILMKSNGTYNYNTTDLAAVYHRSFVENSRHIIYITDTGQSIHFKMLFKLARYVGFLKDNKVCLEHVPCGLVLKQDGTKFKTRMGSVEKLENIIEEAVTKAEKMLAERVGYTNFVKRRTYAAYIGVNSLKYHELMVCRTSDYVYDIDKLLCFDGNTFVFVMYSYVRARSIQKNSVCNVFGTISLLCTTHEVQLALHLYRFPCVFDKSIVQKMPHKIVEYMYELSRIFNIFIENCVIVGSENESSRVVLCQAVAKVLRECFTLLGISTVNRL